MSTNNDDKIYSSIVRIINSSVKMFEMKYGVRPNKALIGEDIVLFLWHYLARTCDVYFEPTENLGIIGLEVSVDSTPGLIEVGFTERVPYKINVNYIGDNDVNDK